MEGAALLQVAATALLNGGFAWLAGSFFARLWLARATPRLLQDCAPLMRRGDIAAAFGCLLGGGVALWAAAAMMAGVDLREAAAMLPMMLSETAYGRAGSLAVAAVFAAGLILAYSNKLWAGAGALVALVIFVLGRASISHAGEHGMLSFALVVEALHLALAGVWLGGVALAAWLVVPAARRRGVLVARYLQQLSLAATVALAGIVASGAWNAYQRLSAPIDLVAHPYGIALTIKLLLVAAAAGLGAYNKFIGFPSEERSGAGPALLVLRVESVLLFGALLAAAALTIQQPPG